MQRKLRERIDKFLGQGILVSAIVVLLLTFALIGYTVHSQTITMKTLVNLENEADGVWNLYDESVKRLNQSQKDYAELNKKYKIALADDNDRGVYEFWATGYTIDDMENQGTNNINACGWDLHNERFRQIPQVAADFDILPKYSIIEIIGWGVYVVSDTGGAIKGITTSGENKEPGLPKLDILCPDLSTAFSINNKVYVKILVKGLTLQ